MGEPIQPPLWQSNLSEPRSPIKSSDGRKLYLLGDRPPSDQGLKILGMRQLNIEEYGRQIRNVMALATGEFRIPKRGEWYLSGAIPVAYLAPNDLGTRYHIAALVLTETIRLEPIVKIIHRYGS